MADGVEILCVAEDLFLCLGSDLGKDLNFGSTLEKGGSLLLIDAIFVLSKRTCGPFSHPLYQDKILVGIPLLSLCGYLGKPPYSGNEPLRFSFHSLFDIAIPRDVEFFGWGFLVSLEESMIRKLKQLKDF